MANISTRTWTFFSFPICGIVGIWERTTSWDGYNFLRHCFCENNAIRLFLLTVGTWNTSWLIVWCGIIELLFLQKKTRKSCKRGPKMIFSTKIIWNGHNKLSLVPRSHHICSEFEKKTSRCTFRRQKRRISCERRPKHKISTKTMKCGHNKLSTFPRSHVLFSEFEKRPKSI